MEEEKETELTKEMIKACGLPILGSYKRSEVCKILGISERTFWRMITEYERDEGTGQPRNPATLDSFMIRGQKRVRFGELVDFITRNNTYESQNAVPKAGTKLSTNN
jgi:hypothetical protein